MVAGGSEWPEGGRFPGDVVRYGGTTKEALREKARYVLRVMTRRVELLGVSWAKASVTQPYSIHDHFEFFREEIAPFGAAHGAITWHSCRPPVLGWEFEMDVKRVQTSRISDSLHNNGAISAIGVS